MATHRKRAVRPSLGPRTTSGPRGRGIKAPRDTTSGASAIIAGDTDPSMAQSFLPFCAHCEQQIVVPNTSILYCSEKCRRKDQAKPPPLPIGGSSLPSYNPYSMTPPLTPYAHDIPEPPMKNYVEPFSPTPPRSVPLDDYPGAQPISIGGHSRSMFSYSPPNDSLPPSPNNNSNIYMPPRRPGHVRTLTGGAIPTMSNLPSQGGAYTTNNAYYQRPLPPLHKPHPYSSSPRSIELVTPSFSSSQPPKAESKIDQLDGHSELLYEKKSTLPSAGMSGRGGSLKTLFNFDAIRGRPITAPNSNYTSRANTASPSPERGFPTATPILTFR